MKTSCVEFYRTHFDVLGEMKNLDFFSWRLRAKNSQIILSPHESFTSHRNAVDSFKLICNALDARGPWEIKDLEGVSGSHAMLTKG